ncbi:hypothetical protein SAMN05444487_11420 [Marininema mesophilum]|uniref:Uncharacterized protein n=1 Tax=Marininema mesophilum TaxID=1048340 RepID=A0A1H3AQR7_9BACL|nr:hypothetical protein [Marininema mesophilum]SDX32017.1 hypothetical protein SAMN05444487_11420 [Marininema mesophilum]
MDVKLEIQDGSPWYLSPDIWTVSGDDPLGTPGQPIVGQPCYIWARVHNNGKDAIQNANVRFYWANPAVGFNRKTANFIGKAYVSLAGSETREVLCLSPWNPSFVNNGHECVMVEASHPYDPLQAGLTFNVTTDRHVAQRNLTVLRLRKGNAHFTLRFELHNPSRLAQTYRITSRVGHLKEIKPLLPHLGHDIPHHGEGTIVQAGFVTESCPDKDDSNKAQPTSKVEIGPGATVGLSVVGVLEGEIALLHVVQKAEEQEIGGLSILVFQGNEQ